ncbi:MAG TPA: type II toxin-antitoxin system RelE/ParE family toxin [Phycisphaerae bacterium]|nr:type II toxin-antitoxin system RelE/ParE family toxin [Phycisphaerae bacterium]
MKDSRFELTAGARLDVLSIWNHLAEEASIEVADYVLRDIEKAIEKVVESPGIGHSRQDLTNRALLFYRVHSYFVVYRRDTVPLRVVRVIHGAQDIGTLLGN